MKRESRAFLLLLAVWLVSALAVLAFLRALAVDRLQTAAADLYERDPEAAFSLMQAFLAEEDRSAPDAANALGLTDRYYGFVLRKALPPRRALALAALVSCPLFFGAAAFGVCRRRRKKALENTALRVDEALARAAVFEPENEEEQLLAMLIGRCRAAEETRARRERELRTYVENVAHSIKTPLAGLSLQLELLREEAGASDRLDAAEEQAKKIRRYISSLLTLARMQAGRVRFERAQVELAELCAEQCAAYGGRVEFCAETADGVTVRGDREWLGEAVGVLLQNAVRYGEGAVRARLGVFAGSARFTVENDGGAPLEVPPARLSERYYVPKEDGTSTGIGLSVAAAVAEAHGGSLVLRPRSDGGMTAALSLPLVRFKEKL
ncbi:MAG: HAMP domain-containing histidine kinase [Clostridia bacterium]|nr:HAMP domain-containing histidine kinase [Clostridia bacterium]